MFTTLVVWEQKLSNEVKTALHQIAEQIQEDSNASLSYSGTEGAWETRRYWDTLENAQSWIDAVTPYNPVSATIIDNE